MSVVGALRGQRMTSALIVTADPNSADLVDQTARAAGARTRCVSDPKIAQNWLTMQVFDAVLIDARFPESTVQGLLDQSWKHSALVTCGLFNLYGPVDGEWDARIMGAKIFAGPEALAGIRQTLEQLSNTRSENSETGILLVDDLDAARDIVRSYIEMMGYQTVVATESVDQALRELLTQPGKFFCVVTDLSMPHKSGIELIKQIRNNPALEHLPVLVLTARPTQENLLECVRAGATGFLVKPPRKKNLNFELEKARRMFRIKQSPLLCRPEDAHLLEEALARRTE